MLHGFDSRHPLFPFAKKKLDKFMSLHIIQHTLAKKVRDAAVAQLAEYVFGKDEVTGSIPVSSLGAVTR